MIAPDIIAVQYLGDHRLELTFADGVHGQLDFARWIIGQGGVFAPLQDKAYFARVSINNDVGTIVWPNDVDFDPDVLYEAVTQSKHQTDTAQ